MKDEMEVKLLLIGERQVDAVEDRQERNRIRKASLLIWIRIEHLMEESIYWI